jgi:hypothetical protein
VIYIFHRAEGFYPLTLESHFEAVANALSNPGTLKITDSENRLVFDHAAPKPTITRRDVEVFARFAENFKRVGQYGEARLQSDIRAALEAFAISMKAQS